jgi:hypothetical protein
MRIHAGFEISYECPQPTPNDPRVDPPISANTYHDVFGNFCHVIRAPAGRLTMSTDFLAQDNGEPDAVDPQAEQHALQDLPVDTLVFLLGSRYCETDRFTEIAWAQFGSRRLSELNAKHHGTLI